MNRLTMESDKGGLAFAFDLDVTCKKEEMLKIFKIGNALKQYEDLELTPEQIMEVDRLYAEKCKEVAELKKSPWIPATEGLPKCEEEVYIQTKNGTMTTAAYEDGTIPNEESIWNWTDIDFDYDEETDTYLVPKGWWEYRHFNPDEVYNNKVDEEVVAWMPLPEPYREDKQ